MANICIKQIFPGFIKALNKLSKNYKFCIVNIELNIHIKVRK